MDGGQSSESNHSRKTLTMIAASSGIEFIRPPKRRKARHRGGLEVLHHAYNEYWQGFAVTGLRSPATRFFPQSSVA